VDDGSTDETCRVVESYAPAVELITQNNAGAAAARNRGIQAAQGDFIGLVDSDDLWHPEKLERQLTRLKRLPDVEICVTLFRNFESPTAYSRPWSDPNPGLRGERRPGYAIPTLLARSRVFDRVGPFDADRRVGENVEWWLRIARLGIVVDLLGDVLVYRRLHHGNTTRVDAHRTQTAFLEFVRASLEFKRQEGASLFERLPGLREIP
jgi:glycosyltransferase involved in cell wall biosynthesis